MKRLCVFAIVLLMVIGLVATGEVLSRNAVGFVKLCVPANGFFMATVPFNDYGDTTPRPITEIFGNQLTGTDGLVFGSDLILKWDPDDQTYESFWKANNAGSPEWRSTRTAELFIPATNTLSPGEAFFFQNNQTSDQCVFVMGEVPDDFTVPTGTGAVSILSGFNHVAYPFPADVDLNATSLSNIVNGGVFGDAISRWDPVARQYVRYFYDSAGAFGGGWQEVNNPGAPTTDQIALGEGVFFSRVGGTVTWEEGKPYTWP